MPQLSRRSFLKALAGSSAAAVLTGCQKPRRWVRLEPYVRPPEEELSGVATWYASTCLACPAGCGIVVRVMNGRALKVEGNPEHPISQGKLCARGQAIPQQLYHPDRLRGPLQQKARGSRDFQPLTWDKALNTVAGRLQEAGSRFAVWEGTATPTHLQHLFETLTGALKTASPVRYDLYTSFYGNEAFGEEGEERSSAATLPAYALSQADVVISFGADFLSAWLSPTRYGVEFGWFRSQPFGKRGTFVQLEPRMSPSGAKADQWLPVRPGSEALVAQALVQLIADGQFGPGERVARAQELASGMDANQVARASDLSPAQLEALARLFASAERPVALPGPGDSVVPTVRALNAVAAAPGTVFSAASLPLPELAPAPFSPPAAVQDLLRRMQNGEVDVLFVHGSNPAHDLSPAAGFGKAIASVPFVVSFANLVDETAVQADLILPDHTTLEGWGYQVASPGFDLPILSSQQPVVHPLYNTRAAGDVLLALAARIPAAAEALPWPDEVAFIEEVVHRLPAGAAGGDSADVRWARYLQHGGWWPASTPTSSPVETALPLLQLPPPPEQPKTTADYPYLLHLYLSEVVGSGGGAALPWLQSTPAPMTTIAWQSCLEVHPDTAATLGLENGDIVQVSSAAGQVEVPVYLYPAIRPDTVALALGQGHTDLGRYGRDRGVNGLALIGAGASPAEPVPVQLTATGRHAQLATFENVLGVREGFVNQDIPG